MLKIIVGTISTTTEKIMLRRREVFQSPSEFGSRKIFGSPDPDSCQTIHAMMVRPGTNMEGGSRVTGTGQVGNNATVRPRTRTSTTFPRASKNLATLLSPPLFTFLLPCVDERTSSASRIVLKREK